MRLLHHTGSPGPAQANQPGSADRFGVRAPARRPARAETCPPAAVPAARCRAAAGGTPSCRPARTAVPARSGRRRPTRPAARDRWRTGRAAATQSEAPPRGSPRRQSGRCSAERRAQRRRAGRRAATAAPSAPAPGRRAARARRAGRGPGRTCRRARGRRPAAGPAARTARIQPTRSPPQNDLDTEPSDSTRVPPSPSKAATAAAARARRGTARRGTTRRPAAACGRPARRRPAPPGSPASISAPVGFWKSGMR